MNVLVICVDTLRWDHVGYNGRVPVITPNIDRLAERATRFDNTYVGSFPTVPMRTDCFTGNVNFMNYAWKPLGTDETVLTEVLAEAGYFCGFVHDTWNMGDMDFGRGFHVDIPTYRPPTSRPRNEEAPCPVPRKNVRQNAIHRQKQAADFAHYRRESDWFNVHTFMKAADWLEDHARRDKWFLWIDTFHVHELWTTPQYYIDLYDPDYTGLDYDCPSYGAADIYSKAELNHMRARYAATVTMTDRWIGHLMAQMDLMNLWDDTLVAFISDHGIYLGEHNRAGKHTVDPNVPWPYYDEVAHIPLLVWAPMRGVKKRVQALAQPADLMATVLDATGLKAPAMTGRSLIPLMRGRRGRNHDAVYTSRHNDRAKGGSKDYVTINSGRWSMIAAEQNHPAELYDSQKDPEQKRDLAREHPEVVKRLQNKFLRFLKDRGASDEYIAWYA